VKVLVAAVAALAALAGVVGRSTAAGTSNPIVVRLPRHVFGQTKVPDGGRLVNAGWGKGPGQVGLVHAESGPTGGSSFDVLLGVVCILDQHNGRVLVFEQGKAPRATRLVVTGAAGSVFRNVESSLAVGSDGTIYVLEPVDSLHRKPTLRSFRLGGGPPIATTATAGSNPIVRASGKDVFVSQTVAGTWRRVMTAGHAAGGSPTRYRLFPDGSKVEIAPSTKPPVNVTLTRANGTRSSWRVSSPTPIAPEDAEPVGNNLVLVLRVSTSKATEYEVLTLGKSGLVNSYSVPDDDYAETALFDDFRLEGATLYHRGSTKKGVYVDSYLP
jgi:hypothetical protein